MTSKDAIVIMMVALALGGCTPEQDVAQCELEARRLFPNNTPKRADDDASEYIIACMKVKGYEKGYCFSWGPDFNYGITTRPECYTATGWRRLLTSSKK